MRLHSNVYLVLYTLYGGPCYLVPRDAMARLVRERWAYWHQDRARYETIGCGYRLLSYKGITEV